MLERLVHFTQVYILKISIKQVQTGMSLLVYTIIEQMNSFDLNTGGSINLYFISFSSRITKKTVHFTYIALSFVLVELKIDQTGIRRSGLTFLNNCSCLHNPIDSRWQFSQHFDRKNSEI